MTRRKHGNVFHIAGQHDQSIIAQVESTLLRAKAGEVHGLTGVVDHGGGDFEYVGLGTFARTPGLGLLVATKLVKKYL